MGTAYLKLLTQMDKQKTERLKFEKSRSKKETEIIENNRLIKKEVSETSDIINELKNRIA